MSAEDKTIPTVEHSRAHVERLERAALGCRVFCHHSTPRGDAFSWVGTLHVADEVLQDNIVGALLRMPQSSRLWNRSIDALSRLAPPTSSATAQKAKEENPFEVLSDAN